MATYTITWNGRQTTINGLPDRQVRYWDNNIKIKFYHRGRYSHPKITATGKIKYPRQETQIYINGKYFLQLSWNLSRENEETFTKIFKDLYCFGCSLEEIKRLLKASFYQPK